MSLYTNQTIWFKNINSEYLYLQCTLRVLRFLLMLKPYFFVTWRHSSFACFPVFSLKRGILELTIILTVYVAIVLIKLVKKWCFFFAAAWLKLYHGGSKGALAPSPVRKKITISNKKKKIKNSNVVVEISFLGLCNQCLKK